MKISIAVGLAAAGVIGVSPAAIATSHLPAFNGYSPSAQCRSWYDGCNMCERSQNGAVACSQRVCQNYGKGFCRENFPAPMWHASG
jgi:hypothetical protein